MKKGNPDTPLVKLMMMIIRAPGMAIPINLSIPFVFFLFEDKNTSVAAKYDKAYQIPGVLPILSTCPIPILISMSHFQHIVIKCIQKRLFLGSADL